MCRKCVGNVSKMYRKCVKNVSEMCRKCGGDRLITGGDGYSCLLFVVRFVFHLLFLLFDDYVLAFYVFISIFSSRDELSSVRPRCI